MRESLYKSSTVSHTPTQAAQNIPDSNWYQHSSTVNSISITKWNCRGLANAVPYIDHLIETGSDVITITEHWLWPFHLNRLEEINPLYTGVGFSSAKLNESSDLCGGVGIIWKKILPIVPVTQIVSDRFCAVQLLSPDSESPLYIFSV